MTDYAEKLQIYEELLRRKRKEVLADYYEFVRYFWDTVVQDPLVENWHLRYLAAELQKVGERLIERLPKEYDLVINVPPGSSKSTLITVLFPAWLWAKDPSLRIISVSHSESLSIEHAVLSRDCLTSDSYRAMFGDRFAMRRDSDAKAFYKNDKGGSRRAKSVGSKVTGQHAHLILEDDLIDPKGVKSKVILEAANDYQNKTLSSRKVDKALTPTILVMQRLHEDDPTGDLLKQAAEGREIRHISLPATVEDLDNEHTADQPVTFKGETKTVREWYLAGGGYLDPVRMGQKVLSEAESTLGARDYAGQFRQRPRQKEGNIVKDRHLQVLDESQLPSGLWTAPRFFVMDTAFEMKKENDPSAILCCSVYQNNLYLIAYSVGKWAFSDLVERTKEFVDRHGKANSLVYIEPKASGVSLFQYLRRHSKLPVLKYTMPRGDKLARVNAVEPFLESGRVYVIKGPWNEKFIEECTMFPNAAHDEAIDCLTMGCEIAFRAKPQGRRTSAA